LRQAYDYWQNQPGNYRVPGARRAAPEGGRPRRGARIVDRSGTGGPEPQDPARSPGAKARGGPAREIQLPPLSSPGDGPPQEHFGAREGPPPHCDIRPPGGGYQPPITPGGGYRLQRAPECLRGMVANGQQSTDSIGASRHEGREDLRRQRRRFPPPGPKFQGRSRRHRRRPPPRPEQVRAPRAIRR